MTLLPHDRSRRGVPPRALALSVAALLVPVAGALMFPEALGDFAALLWLLALVPAFLLAYHRGWRGVATALAAGMATLSLTQVVVMWWGKEVSDLLLAVVVAYLAIALGIGWVAERLHRERSVVEDLAFTDSLTGLPNRRHAEVFLENEYAAGRRGRLVSVVLFDLDGFKAYNDRYGHQAGDQALEVFARVLARTTRRMNLSARFGGEEFITVLAGSDSEGAVTFAERVRTTLRAEDLGDPPLTVSAGVASFHPSMEGPDQLVAAADEALYEAKRAGRNCVRVAESPEPPETGGPPGEAPGTDRLPSGATDGAAPRDPETAGPPPPSPPPPTPEEPDGETLGSGRRILLVEDESQVRALMRKYLEREGFAVDEAGDVMGGVQRLGARYDVVITDINLPGASGNELVAAVKTRWPETQVLVITGLQGAHVAAHALDAGADRYLFKPFGIPELRAHLEKALSQRDRMVAVHAGRGLVNPEARERAREARNAVLKGAHALVRAVEVRDPFTSGHSERVAEYALVLARELDPDGLLLDPPSLRLGCQLHDIGKIGVPDAVLNKKGRLDEDELERIHRHPTAGRRILEPLLDDEIALSVVRWHHERWDGTGYPDGLAGETIPLAARVVGIVDVFDAMTNDRAWRKAVPWGKAAAEVRRLAGTWFDPEVVPVFERALPELRRIRRSETDGGAVEA